MTKPLLIVGLGGFGKWVVTAFKTRIMDAYGRRPEHIDWVALDLIGEEVPTAQFTRFELGQVKQERLDFSPTSQEFLLFGADYASYIRRAEQGVSDDERFAGRLTRDDAELLVLSDEKSIPAAERRHASMLQFQLRLDAVNNMLARKLHEGSIVFVVNSIAGGTGTGTFIDLLLLLRRRIRQFKGKLVSILLLPEGFARVKQNEDMNPLYGNCYAAFREFMRLQHPKGNTRLCFSKADLDLALVSKDSNSRHLADVTYILDGTNFGRGVEYYRSVVPAIASFIEQSFMAAEQEAGRTETSYDQAQSHALSNLLKPADPYNAFALSSFGTHRMLFDRDAVKTGFAHEIALKAFRQFLDASWLPEPEFAVKEFTLSKGECTKFAKDLVHDCVTKRLDATVATYRGLMGRLVDDVHFPELEIGGIQPHGSLADTKKIIDKREEFRLGQPGDKHAGQARPTIHAVCDYYLRVYTTRFRDLVGARVLQMMAREKGSAGYGRGSLRACERFVGTLRDWYVLFLRGNPEANLKARFAEACDLADVTEGTEADATIQAQQYFDANRNRRKLFSDLRKKYVTLRARSAELKARDLMRVTVLKVAQDNLAYLETLHQDIVDWLETFEDAVKAVEKAANNLREVRRARENIVTDEYLTMAGDSIEQQLFNLVVDDAEYTRIKEGKELRSAEEQRLHEVIGDIPHPGWAAIVNGFMWSMNRPDKQGHYQFPDARPGAMVCSVPAAMPNFPGRGHWSKTDYVSTWNYELVRYYLTEHRLNELDRLSAFKVLMLRGDKPAEVLAHLMQKSVLMTDISDETLRRLDKPDCREYAPESHHFIYADDSHQEKQTQLSNWIAEFKAKVKALPERSYTEVWDKSRPHILAFSTARYSLPASAVSSLDATERVYRDRLERRTPPPLHILPGEKEATIYEARIAGRLRRDRPTKLHPQVVSLLERKDVVRKFVLGIALEIVRRDSFTDGEHRDLPCVFVKDSRFDSVLEPASGRYLPPLFCDVLYELVYPNPGKVDSSANTINDLVAAVDEAMGKLNKSDQTQKLTDCRANVLSWLKKNRLPAAEHDLLQVWVEMLDE